LPVFFVGSGKDISKLVHVDCRLIAFAWIRGDLDRWTEPNLNAAAEMHSTTTKTITNHTLMALCASEKFMGSPFLKK
jgi:hypothetical protein